jgi:hypothetical protein
MVVDNSFFLRLLEAGGGSQLSLPGTASTALLLAIIKDLQEEQPLKPLHSIHRVKLQHQRYSVKLVTLWARQAWVLVPQQQQHFHHHRTEVAEEEHCY